MVDDRAFLVLGDERAAAVRDELRDRALEASDDAATVAIDAGVTVETAVDSGHPAESILAHADANGVDLIVMGTSGDEYETNVVGSISQQVVRTSPVPVLTVGPTV